MILKQTKLTRVLLGRLERGEEVVSALAEAARAERIDAGFVRAHGILEDAEIALLDPASRLHQEAWRDRGPAIELASLLGTIALREGRTELALRAVIARPGAVSHAAAGLLVSAHALAVEFAIDAYDDARVNRIVDPATGLAVWDP